MCNTCNETIRKDTYITHILKAHPEYMWNDIFRPFRDEETGVWDLRNRAQLKEAINVLEADGSYELDDEVYADFGSKQTFKNSATATKHIQKHADKHRSAFCQLIKEGLTEKNLLELLKWIAHRPVKVINDMPFCRNHISEEVAKAKQELNEKDRLFMIELYEAKEVAKRCKAIMETDEFTEYEKNKERCQQMKEDIRILQDNLNTVTSDMNHYKSFYDDSERRNKGNLNEEKEAIAYWEKSVKANEQKMKKHEAECDKKIKYAEEIADKKVKQADEDAVYAKEKLEKQIKKLKSDIKAYKQEIQLVKLRAKAKESDEEEED
jgi:hypothetical protein